MGKSHLKAQQKRLHTKEVTVISKNLHSIVQIFTKALLRFDTSFMKSFNQMQSSRLDQTKEIKKMNVVLWNLVNYLRVNVTKNRAKVDGRRHIIDFSLFSSANSLFVDMNRDIVFFNSKRFKFEKI